MLYLLSLVLVVTTFTVCILKQTLDKMFRIERELKESHGTLTKLTSELERVFTEQLSSVADIARKAQLSTSSYTSRVEELNNKIAGLSLKK